MQRRLRFAKDFEFPSYNGGCPCVWLASVPGDETHTSWVHLTFNNVTRILSKIYVSNTVSTTKT
jgi:hypothetical protein